MKLFTQKKSSITKEDTPYFIKGSCIDEIIKEAQRKNFIVINSREIQERELNEIARCTNSHRKHCFVGVNFPWRGNEVVIIPDKESFQSLITWRNKDKITEEEQQKLRQSHVFVVGSSVGSNATHVMAKSGIENFNIAEIKEIKPSNGTRIISDSVVNWGLHKLDALKKDLYEYNPYLNLKLFNEGLNADNIEAFFQSNAQNKVVLDAADDVPTKILIRKYCKKHKIPMLTGFDEKGVIIINRFDKEDVPIAFENEDFSNFHSKSFEEKTRYFMEYFPNGYENLTDRQKQTIERIKDGTLGGYSQLAWEAALFSSMITKSVLDIILYDIKSGNYSIDLDKINNYLL